MFNISKLVNKITDRGQGSGRDGSGDQPPTPGHTSFSEPDELLSAEGFLCPQCMRAFPSAEALLEHNLTHEGFDNRSSVDSTSNSSNNGDLQMLRDEIQILQSSLAEEKTTAEEMRKEVKKMQQGFQSREDDNASVKSMEKEFESAKSLLSSEVTLLRQQLVDRMEEMSQLRKQKDNLEKQIAGLSNENSQVKAEVANLQAQLQHKNSTDDAAVLKKELVRVQRMMDELSSDKDKDLQEKQLEIDTAVDSIKTLMDKVSKSDEEIKLAKEAHAADKLKLQQEQELLSDKLSDVTRRKEAAEKESVDFKEEIKRLQEQHAELYQKIEGDEGAKAALESLRKENETLKENLDAAAKSHAEKLLQESTNLYNVTKSHEKAQLEIKKLNESHDEAIKLKVANEKRLMENLNKQTNETKIIASALQEKTKECENLTVSLGQEKQNYKNAMEEFKDLKKANEVTKQQFAEQARNLEAKEQQLVDAIAKKDTEFQLYCDESKQTLEQSAKKLTEISEEMETYKEKIRQLNHEHTVSNEEMQKLVATKDCLETKKLELEREVQEHKEKYEDVQLKLLDVENSEKVLRTELEAKNQEIKQAIQNLNDSKADSESLKVKLLESEKGYAELKKTSSERVEMLEKKLQAETRALQIQIEQLNEVKQSSQLVEKSLSTQLEQSTSDLLAAEKKVKDLEKTIQNIKSQSKENEDKVQVLQLQADEILGDKIEMEKKLKCSEEEKSLLLEKCLAGEREIDEMKDTIKGMQRKLEDCHAALQELGRENQSLQIESAKLQGRKWADDSVATNCSTCDKEFSLYVRRHHCRHCGQIFCNDCSSRNASVPSCKKPARVCDVCYQELTLK